MVQHIGYKVALGFYELDQFEKTFFLMFNDPASSFRDPLVPVTDLVEIPDELYPLENEDERAFAAFAELRGRVGHGPFLRYLKLVSNTNVEQLFYWTGIHTSHFEVRTGYKELVGGYSRFHTEHSEVTPWEIPQQMSGLRDSVSPVRSSSPMDPNDLSVYPPFARS